MRRYIVKDRAHYAALDHLIAPLSRLVDREYPGQGCRRIAQVKKKSKQSMIPRSTAHTLGSTNQAGKTASNSPCPAKYTPDTGPVSLLYVAFGLFCKDHIQYLLFYCSSKECQAKSRSWVLPEGLSRMHVIAPAFVSWQWTPPVRHYKTMRLRNAQGNLVQGPLSAVDERTGSR